MINDVFYDKTKFSISSAPINIRSVLILLFSLVLVVLIMISTTSINALVYAAEEEYMFIRSFGSQGPKDSQFISPYDIAISTDPSGNDIYVVDFGSSRIQKFTNDYAFNRTWGSQGTGNAQFSFPSSIAIDPAGNVYIFDWGNSRVQKFTGDGSYITEWNIPGPKRGQFTNPPGIAVDSEGNVYVSNTTGHNIVKYSPDGSLITSWGKNGFGDDQFSFPSSIDVDHMGNIYVVDSGSHRVKKFTSDGKFITKWGSQGTGDGEFISPSAISTDASGDVYVADTGNNRAQKFTNDGKFITKWSDGKFNKPSGIAIDSLGVVYIVDTGNHQIDIFVKANQPPIALVGPDQIVDENTTVTLDGTRSSDEDGNITSYIWKQTAGNQSVVFSGNNNTAKPTFIAPNVSSDTTLQFALMAVDNNNATSTTADTVTVRVKNIVNHLPVAEDKSVTTDQNHPIDIVLTGSDADNDTLTFQILTNTSNGSLKNFDNYTGKVTYTPNSNYSGTDSFTFRVRDNKLEESSNIGMVSITVNSVNVPPIANAGVDQPVNTGSTVKLDGTASKDPDNDPITYSWKQIEGPMVTLDNANVDTPSFTAPNVSSDTQLKFSLTVKDDKGDSSSPASVTVTIKAAAPAPSNMSTTKGTPSSSEQYSFITTWGSDGLENGEFNGTEGIAIDSQNNVYVADTFNNRIQKFTSDGTFITTWGSDGSENGELSFPSSIAIDSQNNVYVADYFNNRIQKFTSDGTFITTWGSAGSENGEFDYPEGIAIDSQNNVYVADSYISDSPHNNRIQKFTSDGTFITTWGSDGSENGEFNFTQGIAIDSQNNVYVADSWNDRIQKFTSDGTFITTWGSYGSENEEFGIPSSIAIDSSGNVYVAESGNNRIQKFTSDGTFITTWGSAGSENGEFDYPQGIAIDSQNNVYVADTENNRIQVFSPNT
jgi:phosphohistidine swiveling domain-containing protein